MSTGRLIWAVIWRLALAAIVFCVLAILPTLWIPEEGTPKDFDISTANTRVELQDDAGLRIRETLEFHYHGGTFTGAYRDIPLREGAKITGVAVFEGDRRYRPGGNTALGSFDQPGTFGITKTPDYNGVRVVWHYGETDTEKTFALVYDLEKAVTAYDDVVDVGWTVWGDQWQFWLDELEAEIATPDGTDPTAAWVSSFDAPEAGVITPTRQIEGTRALGADPEIGDGGATFETERVPQGTNVVFRALVPRVAVSSASGARVVSGNGADKVIAEEDGISNTAYMKAKNFVFDNAWLVFGLWTLIVVGLSLLMAIMSREHPTGVPRYVNEPPEDLPPAIAYALATEGAYDDRVVLATLLSLVDRGYYDAKASQGQDLDLELTVAADRPASNGLEEYERTAMKFFDDLLDGNTVALGKLKDEIPEHSSTWRTRWNELTNDLDQADEGRIGWDRNFEGKRVLLAVVALVGYLVLGWLFFARTQWLAIPFGTAVLGLLFVYLFPRTMYKRLDPAARERGALWAAFRRWTDDFPRLDDDPPATLKLWRSILVYAVAFGTAEAVAKSGRIPAPVGEEATSTGSWTAFALYGGAWNSDFNSFGSGFSSQVAPESSSSSGGGGFSGGGGGFSGGGGGGAW
jgi:uncharacterized membrane protein YgcG